MGFLLVEELLRYEPSKQLSIVWSTRSPCGRALLQPEDVELHADEAAAFLTAAVSRV